MFLFFVRRMYLISCAFSVLDCVMQIFTAQDHNPHLDEPLVTTNRNIILIPMGCVWAFNCGRSSSKRQQRQCWWHIVCFSAWVHTRSLSLFWCVETIWFVRVALGHSTYQVQNYGGLQAPHPSCLRGNSSKWSWCFSSGPWYCVRKAWWKSNLFFYWQLIFTLVDRTF